MSLDAWVVWTLAQIFALVSGCLFALAFSGVAPGATYLASATGIVTIVLAFTGFELVRR